MMHGPRPCLVVKLGGHAVHDGALLDDMARDILSVQASGMDVVLVHGGGPQIDAALEAAGIQHQAIQGLRVTPPEAMAIIDDVLVTQVRPQLIDALHANGVSATGVSAHSRGILRASLHVNEVLQRVGEIASVEPGELRRVLHGGDVAVVTALASLPDGSVVNVNADTAASAIAAEIGATHLVLLTNVKGVYRDFPNADSLIRELSLDELRTLDCPIDVGMLPKIDACVTALERGVEQVIVADGRESHVIKKIFQGENTGTKVTRYESETTRSIRHVDVADVRDAGIVLDARQRNEGMGRRR